MDPNGRVALVTGGARIGQVVAGALDAMSTVKEIRRLTSAPPDPR